MKTSSLADTSSPKTDGRVRLRTEVYEALAKSRGYRTVVAQARWHGIGRQHMSDLRSGRSAPRLDTAMKIAADLGVAVEVIWERVAA